jgi:hypothetical protein
MLVLDERYVRVVQELSTQAREDLHDHGALYFTTAHQHKSIKFFLDDAPSCIRDVNDPY